MARHGALFSQSVRLASTAASQPVSADRVAPLERNKALGRPISPHMTIYRPQITSIVSGAFRVSSVAMTTGVYVAALVYAARNADATSYLNALAALELPPAAFVAGKLTLSTPFMFHFFNGIRHMTWDTGAMLSNDAVAKSGWAVLGLTAATAGFLSFFL